MIKIKDGLFKLFTSNSSASFMFGSAGRHLPQHQKQQKQQQQQQQQPDTQKQNINKNLHHLLLTNK